MPPHLTRRQLEVVRLVANGLTNAEIGRELWIHHHTVAGVLLRACRALGARDRAHAVALAMVAGLITAADIRQPGAAHSGDVPRHGPTTALRAPRTPSRPLAPHDTATTPHGAVQPVPQQPQEQP